MRLTVILPQPLQQRGETTTVIAYLDLDAEMNFVPKSVQFSFGAIDKKGRKQRIIYYEPKPQDFERSEEITLTGYDADTAFIATEILMKCPSKYNEQNEVDSEKILQITSYELHR